MSPTVRGLCAVLILVLAASNDEAAIIRTSRHASTSNKTVATTTSGQRSILMTIDPLDVASFNLEVRYEADKVEFTDITGLNGYVIDSFDNAAEGSFGGVFNIHGYFPGFNDQVGLAADGAQGAAALSPPQGEIDIFQLTFLDLEPTLDKTFVVEAGEFGYIRSYNDADGTFDIANGDFDPATGIGVDPATSTVQGITSAPLPGALPAGLIAGAGVLVNALRKRAGAR